MTESNTDKLSVQLNEAFSRLEQQPPSEDTSMKTTQSGGASTGGMGGIAAILLSLLAIGIASYGAFMAYQIQQRPVAVDSALQQQVVQLGVELKQVSHQIEGNQTATADRIAQFRQQTLLAQNESMASLQNRVTSMLDNVKQDLGTSSEDWLLAEAEYLLRLGNQRIVTEKDATGALTMLRSADKIIRDSEGVVAFDLRQALAEDIASLEAVPPLDIEGYFVQLGAMIKQVDKLQQKRLEYHIASEPLTIVTSEATVTARILGFLNQVVDRIIGLVDYRNDGDVITPILPPQEEYYLRQNLIMQFQLAQLGLLQGNQAVFESSLAESAGWVNRYFDPQDAATIGIVGSIGALQQVTVERQLPDVSKSLREMKKLLSRFHQQAERGSTRAAVPADRPVNPVEKINDASTMGPE